MELKSDPLSLFLKMAFANERLHEMNIIALQIPKTYTGSFLIEGIIHNELKIIDI